MKYIVTLLLFLLVFGCSTDSADPRQMKIQPWNTEMIRGKDFSLIDDEMMMYLAFFDSGDYVAATIGEKGGAIASPLWKWLISDSGELLIQEEGGRVIHTLVLIDYTDKLAVVRNRRKTEKFKISQ